MTKKIIKKRILLSISSVIILVILALTIGVLFMHTGFFADRAAGVLGSYYLHGTDYKLEIGKISGNPLNRLTIRNVIVRYAGEDFSYDVIRIDKIYCQFDLVSLLGSKHNLEKLSFFSPHLWIKPSPAKADRIPGGSEVLGRLFRFTVEELLISNGQVIYQGSNTAEAVKNIDLLASVVSEEEAVYLHTLNGSCDFITRKININEMKGDIVWKPAEKKRDTGSSISLENYSVRTGTSKLKFEGSFDPRSMNINLHVNATPFDFEELTRALNFETETRGRLTGVFDLRSEGDSLDLKGETGGIIGGFALENFDFDITAKDSTVRFNHFKGGLNGAYVEGDGVYLFDAKKMLNISLKVENVDLSKGFYPGIGLPETDFTGKMGIEYYFSNGEMKLRFELKKGHFRRFPFEHADIYGIYRADSLFLKNVRMVSPTHTADIHGSITGKDEVNLFVDVQCEASDTLFPYFNIEQYRSGINVRGLWRGTFDSWDLRVSGECRNFEYRNVLIPDGQIKLAMKRAEHDSLFLDLSGDSCYIDPFEFSGIELSLDYSGGRANIKRLNLRGSDFKASMWGEIIKDGDLTKFAFRDVLLETLGEEWMSSGNFDIVIGDSTMLFDDLQFHSKLGALYFGGTLNKSANTLNGKFSFDRLDASLLNRSGLISVPLEGKARGALTFTGDISDPSVKIDLGLSEGAVDTLTVKSLAVNASYRDGFCEIDSLSLSTTAGFGFASGTIEGTSWKEIKENGVDAFRHAVVDLEIYSAKLKMKPFAEYFGNVPFSDGTFTGKLVLTDSLAHPEIYFDGAINDLALRHIIIPRVDVHAWARGDRINFGGTIFVPPSGEGKLDGFLPLRKKKWFYSLDKEKPVNFNLVLPDCDLDKVDDISDLVAEADGVGSLRFSVEGSINDPDLSGSISLLNAGFRPAGLEERFWDVNSQISLEDTLIKINSLRGKEGKNGKFNCSGNIVLREWKPVNYDVSIDLDKVLVAGIRDVMAVVSGRLMIGNKEIENSIIPSLTGDLKINKVELYYDLAKMGEGGNGMNINVPSWLAEINLDIEGDARIRTPDANVEFLGEVVLFHDRNGTYIRGTLRLHRGWYNIYNNKFRIISGTLVFANAGQFRPIVDIEAETLDPEGKRIYLTILWDEDDPQPRLSLHHEDSGYSETDIWKMLGGGIVGSRDGNKDEWDALGTAQNLAANYFENVLNSQMEGFTVSLEQNTQSLNSHSTAGEKETMLAVGKYLSQGLYVKYKQGLTVFTERNFEVEYRISDLFMIRSEYMHSDRAFIGESRSNSDEVNFDIKVRWEF
ncbi:MAG: translocation/assembly module TamB domain-containing protein [Candidatus Krumholzibacteriota bacterium]|nr:translocation/assembly module TamB domain-containing protein [Candidatus Krumholzibacteriota bacterium]